MPTRAAGGGSVVARLRAMARYRKWGAALLLASPLLFVLLTDARIRGDRLLALPLKYKASYAVAMVESGALWALLLFAASSRRGYLRWVAALAFVVLATLAMGGQTYFHRQYSTYLNLDATLFGTSVAASLFGQLKADGRNFLASTLPPLIGSILLVWLGRFVIRPSRSKLATAARLLAPVAVVAVFLIPCSYRTVQASTPDVIYFHALGGLMKQLTGVRTQDQIKPGLRTVPSLPQMIAAPKRPRNVVFILTESVRFDATCTEFREACPAAPAMNAAAPHRKPLLQVRSNSSTTAIQLAVLWSGLEPIASREALHSAPLLFDYARAAGIDDAYWTSHHMMFANSRLFVQDLPTSHQCGATDLDPLADIDLGGGDELLAKRVERDLPEMKEPFFGVVHFGNTHVPYRVDPSKSPFQPSIIDKSPEGREGYMNYYRNAVFLQDGAIGEVIKLIRSQPYGDRTVIVFTSDHGEGFHDHGQVGHTGSIYDEEIHIPFWIDAPPGTLTPEEEAQLDEDKDRLAFSTDVTPTILDLMGLWDRPEITAYRKGLVGSSLLRPAAGPPPTLALSNCSGIWGCAFKNYGMMRGNLKLEAREWDSQWHCWDVLADPLEKHDLGPVACGDLPALADRVYGALPSAR